MRAHLFTAHDLLTSHTAGFYIELQFLSTHKLSLCRVCFVSAHSWIANGMKLIKRLFTEKKCLTVIPGIYFHMRRVVKLLLLIKPLTGLFTSSCENPAACQNKLPVMFWARWCLPLDLPKPHYLPSRHSSFKSSSSVLGLPCRALLPGAASVFLLQFL